MGGFNDLSRDLAGAWARGGAQGNQQALQMDTFKQQKMLEQQMAMDLAQQRAKMQQDLQLNVEKQKRQMDREDMKTQLELIPELMQKWQGVAQTPTPYQHAGEQMQGPLQMDPSFLEAEKKIAPQPGAVGQGGGLRVLPQFLGGKLGFKTEYPDEKAGSTAAQRLQTVDLGDKVEYYNNGVLIKTEPKGQRPGGLGQGRVNAYYEEVRKAGIDAGLDPIAAHENAIKKVREMIVGPEAKTRSSEATLGKTTGPTLDASNQAHLQRGYYETQGRQAGEQEPLGKPAPTLTPRPSGPLPQPQPGTTPPTQQPAPTAPPGGFTPPTQSGFTPPDVSGMPAGAAGVLLKKWGGDRAAWHIPVREQRANWVNPETGQFAKGTETPLQLTQQGFTFIDDKARQSTAQARAALAQVKVYEELAKKLLTNYNTEGGIWGVLKGILGVKANQVWLAAKRAAGDPDVKRLDGMFGRIATMARATGDTANIAVAEREMLKEGVTGTDDTIESAMGKLTDLKNILEDVSRGWGTTSGYIKEIGGQSGGTPTSSTKSIGGKTYRRVGE